MTPAHEVIELWFGERARTRWFATDPLFDDEIRARFAPLIEPAASGALDGWLADAGGALALVVVLDQFPRNLHRGSPQAFAHDGEARRVAGVAIERGLDLATPRERRMFFYLPFEHSELLADQDRSVRLFTSWVADHPAEQRAATEDEMTYVHRHREIIERFGRFPHRNAALGRVSTPAELAFLAQPKSTF